MPFLYILRCADNAIYVGSTINLDERIRRHQSGRGCQFTARRTPVALVFVEEHPDLRSALNRERQIKRWTRAKKEALIAGDQIRLKYPT